MNENLKNKKVNIINIKKIILTFLLILSYFLPNFKAGKFLTRDFIQYWSSFNLAIDGLNPYNLSNMTLVQKELGAETIVMMFLSPVLLIIFYPILIFSFSTSTYLFFFLSVISIIISKRFEKL